MELFVGDCFATLGADARLKLFDTESGVLRQSFVEKNQFSAKYTCLAWSGATPGGDDGSRKAGLGFMAVGSASGAIILWDLKRGVVVHRFGGDGDGGNQQNTAVTDLCMNKSGTLLYSSSSDKHVLEWNTQVSCALHTHTNTHHTHIFLHHLSLSPELYSFLFYFLRGVQYLYRFSFSTNNIRDTILTSQSTHTHTQHNERNPI
jgi:WD40 repeat protein